MYVTIGDPSLSPEVETAKGALRAAFERAARRHPYVDQRLCVTRDAALERVKTMSPDAAVAHLRHVANFFDRYAQMRDREIEGLGFRADGFVIAAETHWRMPPAPTAQPGEEMRSYIANLGRRGITLSLELNGDVVAEPPHLVTDADRAEIAKRGDALRQLLRARLAA